MRDLASLDSLFEHVQDGLDILVNNAAINPPTAIRDVTPELFDRVMTVNAKFPLPAMRRAEPLPRDGGRVVNVSTLNTVLPVPGLALYSASKGALEQTTAFTALGRLGTPEDIAGVVAFLAGPDGRWITGQNIRATGGFVV
ncbi:SDR family oxidoreductase [Actinomadura soli]|uniref:SDR family oxidoreductase n=1 Tax=Actinomadura soli TaxID=2508997 RepID=A0A5C4J9S4_9ACTN|nr:SDR family oxidoreductase [Actinomadura soli]TMQ94172.1 SDR family oxidoreductase [Actinomadura soli]